MKRTTVQEFVRISHFDADGVRQMVAEEPQLVVASWDWGGGDYESGLGAASHVGNREIAEFLLEHGARPNLFAAAMLGWDDVVRGFLTRHPALIDCTGPHGLSLIHHARAGGEQAASVLAYLENLGAK
ncbi:MAG: ankyrin repeat domain-containing protein [candidate division Zixibacteria bacterium]|nr:ankyrin repeat domain-containing protein [candidate division Zixibacteria bacterium]